MPEVRHNQIIVTLSFQLEISLGNELRGGFQHFAVIL